MSNEFGYTLYNGQVIYDEPDTRRKFLEKKPHEYRGFEKHRSPKGKSNPQIRYYWGLLIPEVTKALQELGWTVTIGVRKSFERPWTKDDTHEWLKVHAAKVGDDGENVTLSEHDLEQCSKFITNVLWICERWLNMDVDKLKAKQPKGE
jgi:hypothetical protein